MFLLHTGTSVQTTSVNVGTTKKCGKHDGEMAEQSGPIGTKEVIVLVGNSVKFTWQITSFITL